MNRELETFELVNKAECYLEELEKRNKDKYLKLIKIALNDELDTDTEKLIFLCSYTYNPRLINYVLTYLYGEIVNIHSDLQETIDRIQGKEEYKHWNEFLENPEIVFGDSLDMDNLAKLSYLVSEASKKGKTIGKDINDKEKLENYVEITVMTALLLNNETLQIV